MSECICSSCQTLCKSHPGWFMPDQLDAVALFLGISVKELFNTKLMVEWWVRDPKDIFVISPAYKDCNTGVEAPQNPGGECIFYNHGLCEIYDVRPYECTQYHHSNFLNNADTILEVVDSWSKHQDCISNLLEREPNNGRDSGTCS